jgi:hypothetical protein
MDDRDLGRAGFKVPVIGFGPGMVGGGGEKTLARATPGATVGPA